MINGNRYVSCDYGTQNATVFLLWNKGTNGKWYCIREYYYSGRDKGKQKTDSEYADDLKEWLDGTKIKAIIVDPSAASFIAELRKRGYKVLKANNDVLDGIRLVGMLLNLEKIVFASSCKETIKEFASYHYMATVVTTNYKYELDIENNNTIQATTELAVPHYLGEIPIIEYLNNKLAIGDFELQIPLIDAYNALMSDRVTDKEQFIDAILAIYGTLLTDEDEPNTEDEDESIRKAKARLKKYKVLEMPDTAKAEYLTRTFDESGVEILKKAIEQDIHKFSHIPCMSDESFGGNVSGVAMEFKLLGMENITKIKTRYYKKGLRKRIRIFCNYLALHGISIDPSGITMTFTRALPKNLLEISQIVANLWGKVSRKTLLSQVPFVDDVDEELKALETEEEENLKRQQEVFGLQDNTPPEQDPDDGEKVDE